MGKGLIVGAMPAVQKGLFQAFLPLGAGKNTEGCASVTVEFDGGREKFCRMLVHDEEGVEANSRDYETRKGPGKRTVQQSVYNGLEKQFLPTSTLLGSHAGS